MNKEGIKQGARVVTNLIKQNTPTILTSLSVAGVFGTTAMGIAATPKAMKILDENCFGSQYNDPLTKREIIELTWKCYIPTALMGLTTIFCVVGANSINLRRNAALASVYSLTEAALKEYQAKVVETIGEKKEQKIRDEIAQDRVDNRPAKEGIIFAGTGETLCYDSLSDRYFRSDMETLRGLENEINHDLIQDMYVTQNMVYDKMGLAHVKTGDDVGWNTDHMLEINYSSALAKGGVPCMVISFRHLPNARFRD